ncbi:MAG: lytic transglycosylase domain-containing protein [Acidobacteria bacterium]|nr:lytic transglycosylase domain-containing protein [Acidobacteriota bacterium]
MRRRWIVAGAIIILIAAAGKWLDYHTSRYDYIISQAAARNGVDFHLVKAIIYEESWFRSNARGLAGEIGLMQITKAAATDFSVHKGFPPVDAARLEEPELNVEIGCWYLRRSLDRYKSSPQPVLYALLRYNAGESRSDNWLRIALKNPLPGSPTDEYYLSFVDFPKTKAYARRIMHRARNRNYWY